VEAGRSPNVEIITNAEVQNISGQAGDFRVTVLSKPRFVDGAKCTGCGMCSQYCPVSIPDPHNQNLAKRKAIDILYTQAVPSSYSVCPDYCLFLTRKECKQCTRACQTGAINFEQKPETAVFSVGAVILATGFTECDPSEISAYCYKDSPNVVTGREFERISSASGPYGGKISRPSDLKKPQRLAFVQCAGSRTRTSGNEYCSSVCCKYAVKDAIVALEHEPDLDISVFFMDMRMPGKGFEVFYGRAKAAGVHFVRARIAEIERDPETEDLSVKYVTEEGRLVKEVFNLVVLPMGLEPPEGNFALAKAAGVALNRYGFCATSLLVPLATSREGIFVAGGFRGPMALPDSVVQASGAAAAVSELLHPARRTLITERPVPSERTVVGEPLRIGVFICNCGKNIGGVVDVAEVRKYAAALPDVAISVDNLYSCSEDTQALIKDTVVKANLNRVVVAACTPRTHEPLFQETIREAGLNRCLVEMVNIRDQCSWVHAHEREAATEKAKDLVRMAVAKARLIEPLASPLIDVAPKALVIGGGLSGMTAALSLADQGFPVSLVERKGRLGGNLRHIRYTLEGEDPERLLHELVERVSAHKNITVFANAELEAVSGFVGNFETRIAIRKGTDKEERGERHGVIILATGAEALRPTEYLYGRHQNVLLQHELEERLADGLFVPADGDSVVLIQCVGSRDEDRPYCSGICCSMAVKNALKIKELNPRTRVYLLYRDMRTTGFHEEFYAAAREQGVVFIRYRKDQKPVVSGTEDGSLTVTVRDPLLGADVVINAGLVALSTALVPTENAVLEKVLPVPRSADGFYLESHVQLKPVDSYIDGIFLCGMAQFPKSIDESIAQAKAAASRASILLARGHVQAEPIVASCDRERCIGCRLCVSFCPYSAITMTKDGKRSKAEVVAAACKGCGVCASYCPARAMTVGRFGDEQIFAQIRAFGETVS
jgi:heterodisulfide reductase subunit A